MKKTVRRTGRAHEEAAEKKLSTAAKIMARHRLGTHHYSKERLTWARKTFASQGGRARAKMWTPAQRLALSKKASAAASVARKKRAKLLKDLEQKLGEEKFAELLDTA